MSDGQTWGVWGKYCNCSSPSRTLKPILHRTAVDKIHSDTSTEWGPPDRVKTEISKTRYWRCMYYTVFTLLLRILKNKPCGMTMRGSLLPAVISFGFSRIALKSKPANEEERVIFFHAKWQMSSLLTLYNIQIHCKVQNENKHIQLWIWQHVQRPKSADI